MKTAMIALMMMTIGIQTFAQQAIHFANAEAEKAFYRYKKNGHDEHKQLEAGTSSLSRCSSA